MSVRIQLRRDTAANWASTNPTLTQGEPGYETDTGKIKYGDGSTAWNSLGYSAGGAFAAGSASSPSITFTGDTNTGIYSPGADQVSIATGGAQRLAIDSSGNIAVDTNTLYVDATNNRVGIGTTSPGELLTVGGNVRVLGANQVQFFNTNNTSGASIQSNATTGTAELTFNVNGSERFRCDSSGRLLVGTSTAQGDYTLQIQGDATSANAAGCIYLRRGLNTAAIGANVGADLGKIQFGANDGTVAARIQCLSDATWGSTSDTPGALTFSTTPDSGSSPVERLRITNEGRFTFNSSVVEPSGSNVAGIAFGPTSDPFAHFSRASNPALAINRKTNDGGLIDFLQDGTAEGSISVSGTTVSYNGAHLSRWSQLPGGAERTEILRGTVLSNIDEMCGWGEEDNEQLNRMKVSDVEGDPNVAGVFQAWDDDDDTYTDDFYCAMTGDFIIRIAAGIPVHRGQLLMSAGDGTAIPQDDDIVRSKTVAKVTSHHITCTYDDGSYCVPCVLMAC